MNLVVKQFKYGQHTVTLETGAIARQASASVMASMDDTSVFVTVVAKKTVSEDQDFFPLTVDYQEKAYAAGKIPGGFFKREGRPSENEILIARLIDRPIRPLFPEGFVNEIQIVATVVSVNPQISPDLVAMIGASAALSLSGVPFNGPIGAARVGFIDEQLVLNPTISEQKISKLDLVVAGTKNAVLMVESEADNLSEEQMLQAVIFGHQQQQVVIDSINEFVAEAGKKPFEYSINEIDKDLQQKVTALVADKVAKAYTITEKQARYSELDKIKQETLEQMLIADPDIIPVSVLKIIEEVEYNTVRSSLLAGNPRIDGRTVDTVRALDICTSLLPRTHGSALFTRGETQALAVVTLGTERDAQILDELTGEKTDNFIFHYNFPPYSVGEIGRIGSPKRREIGHGRLAKRGVMAVMPSQAEFPYVVRVVSEITESNGSSSMASVCGASLALMDAGVPIKSAVAGIAMGLVKEGDKFVVLSDILGDEDHLGDMDFKVAGTKTGVTALQMDIKIEGITPEIMQIALNQAKGARLHILDVMQQVIEQPREQISEFAPRIYNMKIDPKKIKDVIGKGGATIRSLTEDSGASIDIDDSGNLKIATSDQSAAEKIMKRIEDIVAEVEVNAIYTGVVVRIVDFGAFVSILGGKEGLVHISQISNERIEAVADHLQVGQEVTVKVLEIDRQNRIRLTMKDL